MNRHAALLLATLGVVSATPTAHARSSAAYGLPIEVLDGGGTRAAAGIYGSVGSIGTVVGAQSSAAYGNAGGYLPQSAVTAPALLLAGANPLTFEAAAIFTDPGATASDAEDGTLAPQIIGNTVVANVPGIYAVTWSVTDSSGLTTTATRPVNVVDTTPPVVTGPASFTVHATNPAGAAVTFVPVASDVVGVTSLLASPASGALFANGMTTVTVTAKDAANNTGTGSFTVTVTPLTALENWRYENFGTAGNSGIAASIADSDEDGSINAMEFAFGTDPKNAGAGSPSLEYGGNFAGNGTILRLGQPRLMQEGTDLRVLFVRRKDFVASGLSYTVEFSAKLATWQASGPTPAVLADEGTFQIVSVPFPPFVGGEEAHFFRVRVSVTP